MACTSTPCETLRDTVFSSSSNTETLCDDCAGTIDEDEPHTAVTSISKLDHPFQVSPAVTLAQIESGRIRLEDDPGGLVVCSSDIAKWGGGELILIASHCRILNFCY